jgi:hypothetical protein
MRLEAGQILRRGPTILLASLLAAAGTVWASVAWPAERAITGKAGQPLKAVFEIAAGTGYRWWPVEPLPPTIRFLGNAYESLSPGVAGGKTRQIMSFLMPARGSAEVTVVYMRRWEADDPKDPRQVLRFVATE